ncbi:Arginine biosynthesis biofunctional protein (N-Ac-Glu, N-Ac-Orn synthase) [gamma proteobacterium HdN1]|nr:Arginine biosynthesis biofunctional protein (N-Ac-Glu, N-Ac-Orn synthase) [gamma proteobacterium HdN1]
MAVGPDQFPVMHPVKGFSLGVTRAQIRKPDRRDLVVMRAAPGSTIAGAFTLNVFCAAPVQVCRNHLRSASEQLPIYLVTNTGYANAGRGAPGLDDCLAICSALAKQTEVPVEQIFPFSTGVIGEAMPVDRIVKGLPACLDALDENGWEEAAFGIMTTDTRPKGVSLQRCFQGQTVTITGIVKGAGMIRPNMATMLSYLATDVAIDAGLLQKLVRDAVELSFNRATVDGDTSTNDSCIVIATGQSGVTISEGCEDFAAFREMLTLALVELAQAIVKDGEGATKFVTIQVDGAVSEAEAREIAFTVAHSPLVKTALFASDPNWGRILAAVGRAQVENLDVEKVFLYLDHVLVAERGGLAKSYREALGAGVLANDSFTIRLVLGRGDASCAVWTTDFSYDYVKINADYRS